MTLIINLYNLSIEEYMSTEIMRRHQFQYYLLILECYEKLQTFCYNNSQRKKSITIKSQAIKMIVDSAGEILKKQTLSKLIRGGSRIRSLLEISNNNFNILDAFPDLQPNFFTSTSMNVINFERWLILVKKI